MVNPLQTIGMIIRVLMICLGYSHEYLMLYDKLLHELNIPYTQMAGNMLSSIGFGGMFPWEYDSDFCMPFFVLWDFLVLPVKFKNESNFNSTIARLTKNFTETVYEVLWYLDV